MTQSTSAVLGGPQSAGRRKRTDLLPTLPIHRGEDGRSPRPGHLSHLNASSSSSRASVSRSTGMSVSLSRLDQLSQSRRHKTAPPVMSLTPLHEKTNGKASTPVRSRSRNAVHGTRSPSTPTTATRSMSKSMSHLPPSPSHKTGSSSSSSSSPTAGLLVPRMTRAERLRQKARQQSVSAAPLQQRANNGGSLLLFFSPQFLSSFTSMWLIGSWPSLPAAWVVLLVGCGTSFSATSIHYDKSLRSLLI